MLEITGWRVYLITVWNFALEVCPSWQPVLPQADRQNKKPFFFVFLPVCLHFWNTLLWEREKCWVLATWNLASSYAMLLELGFFFTFYSPNMQSCVELFPGPLPGMSGIWSVWGLRGLRGCLISTPGWPDRGELLLWNTWGLCLFWSGMSSVWSPVTCELLQVQWSSCISLMYWIWMSEF